MRRQTRKVSAAKYSRAAQAAWLLSSLLTGKDVLKIACGTGDFSLAAAETARSVTAIDLEDIRLSPAAAADGRMRFLRMDAAALAFPDGSFDTVVLYNALGHLTAVLPGMLAEALRVLRPGGTLTVCSSFSLDKCAMEERFFPLLRQQGLPFSFREAGPFRLIEVPKN